MVRVWGLEESDDSEQEGRQRQVSAKKAKPKTEGLLPHLEPRITNLDLGLGLVRVRGLGECSRRVITASRRDSGRSRSRRRNPRMRVCF